jgi:hypothetical protein
MNDQPMFEVRWPSFAKELRERLDQGHREYGDGSFLLQPEVLLQHIREEILDICNWSFILYCRLADLESQLKEFTEGVEFRAAQQREGPEGGQEQA